MSTRRTALLGAGTLLLAAGTASAHEPVHSIGPNIGWRGLTAVELVTVSQWSDRLWHGSHDDHDPSHAHERVIDTVLHVAHAPWADGMLFIDAPLRWHDLQTGSWHERSLGAGDVTLGGKWRFWRRQAPARSDQAAIFGAVRLPTGRTGTRPPLGSGRPDAILGCTAGRDALFLYLWGNARVHVPIPGGHRLAPWAVASNLAIGTRFWEPRMRGADFVPLFELGYRAETPSITRGHTDRNTGGQRFTAGPSFLFFFDRFEVKGGLQWTAWRRARGRQLAAEIEVVLGIGILI